MGDLFCVQTGRMGIEWCCALGIGKPVFPSGILFSNSVMLNPLLK